jgi:quercetin dioxygenase-like cupin family protein
MKVRRVVTGQSANGKSIAVHDGLPPRTKDFEHTPGFALSIAWMTAAGAPPNAADITPNAKSILPGPGESSLHIVTFPPDAVMQTPSFNPAAAAQEHARETQGLVEFFEPNNPGMHKTPTVDYGIVLEGEIWLELDDGEIIHLRPHDIVVQNGTRHAWRNKSQRPTTIAFVLLGTTPKELASEPS